MTIQKGDTFEIAYEVTEKVYNGFIDIFDDRNPLHVDEKYAKEKKFSGRVMHGAILTSFLSNFIGERLPVKNVIVLNYKISFLKPVYLADKLKLAAAVTDISEAVNVISINYQFINAANITVSKGEILIKII